MLASKLVGKIIQSFKSGKAASEQQQKNGNAKSLHYESTVPTGKGKQVDGRQYGVHDERSSYRCHSLMCIVR